MGETSGTAIRALPLGRRSSSRPAAGSPSARDVLQVPVDDGEVETLAAVFELLASRPDVQEMERAAVLARREHDLDRVGELYAAACEEAAGGGPVDDAVLREVGAAAAAVGIEPGSADEADVARRLAEVELG